MFNNKLGERGDSIFTRSEDIAYVDKAVDTFSKKLKAMTVYQDVSAAINIKSRNFIRLVVTLYLQEKIFKNGFLPDKDTHLYLKNEKSLSDCAVYKILSNGDFKNLVMTTFSGGDFYINQFHDYLEKERSTDGNVDTLFKVAKMCLMWPDNTNPIKLDVIWKVLNDITDDNE